MAPKRSRKAVAESDEEVGSQMTSAIEAKLISYYNYLLRQRYPRMDARSRVVRAKMMAEDEVKAYDERADANRLLSGVSRRAGWGS